MTIKERRIRERRRQFYTQFIGVMNPKLLNNRWLIEYERWAPTLGRMMSDEDFFHWLFIYVAKKYGTRA